MSFNDVVVFFFQAEDGIRDLVRSRGLGDVYKRQEPSGAGLGVGRGDDYEPEPRLRGPGDEGGDPGCPGPPGLSLIHI